MRGTGNCHVWIVGVAAQWMMIFKGAKWNVLLAVDKAKWIAHPAMV